MSETSFDLIIVGGGTAGLTAGLYACRLGVNAILLERMMAGGQVINADNIENFPGLPEGISGADFGELLHDQATLHGLEIRPLEVDSLQKKKDHWTVGTCGNQILSKAVIVAGGSTLRRLGVPGEERLHGAGVSYCATCDGAFFSDQIVGVVGGGDSALDEAMVLTRFASKIIIFNRSDRFIGQRVLQERAFSNPKIEVHWNTVIKEIIGECQVEGLKVTDRISDEVYQIELSGLFVYVGLDPNTEYLRELLLLDNAGHIPTDIWMRTSHPGLLAAGDIRQNSAAQLISAAGDGATAAIAASRYIQNGDWI